LNSLEMSIAVLFHPIDTFSYIKARERKVNYSACFLLLFMAAAVHITSIFLAHYPLASLQPKDANLWVEIVKLLLPVLTWVIACYAITTIWDGEAFIGEIFAASTYSMMPYIISTVPIALITRVLGLEELQLYSALQTFVWVWVLINFFLNVRTLNDYSMGKTFTVCITSLISMFLIWAVVVLLFALTSQLLQFVQDVLLEIKMLFIR